MGESDYITVCPACYPHGITSSSFVKWDLCSAHKLSNLNVIKCDMEIALNIMCNQDE